MKNEKLKIKNEMITEMITDKLQNHLSFIIFHLSFSNMARFFCCVFNATALYSLLFPLSSLLFSLSSLLFSACTYDEDVQTCPVTVRLVYPENTISPYCGARVQLKDARASVFVDSTDAQGTALFIVPPGIYEVSSAGQKRVYGERYDTLFIYNGVRAQQVVDPDSDNVFALELKVSTKRLFH